MPDETRDASQGALPEKGQPSEGKNGSTSTGTPKTYTEEEVKAITEKTRSDALAEAGRKYKPLEEERTQKLKQLEEQESQLKEREASLAEKEKACGEKIRKAEQTEFESSLAAIAGKYENGDAQVLRDFASDFKTSDPGPIEKYAARIWKQKTPSNTVLTIDSGMTKGGGIDISKLSGDQKVELGLKKSKEKK
jgi:hypothetical protein